jgi:hypothetical protein
MKKISVSILTTLLICAIVLPVPAFAGVQASDQISSYAMAALPASNSRIAIQFSITGTGQMSVIGAQNITIFKKVGSYWESAGSFTQNNTGMTRTNAFNYGNTLYFSGVSGTNYRVDVTVFAQDSSGASDSRSQSFPVTTT